MYSRLHKRQSIYTCTVYKSQSQYILYSRLHKRQSVYTCTVGYIRGTVNIYIYSMYSRLCKKQYTCPVTSQSSFCVSGNGAYVYVLQAMIRGTLSIYTCTAGYIRGTVNIHMYSKLHMRHSQYIHVEQATLEVVNIYIYSSLHKRHSQYIHVQQST